MLYKAQVHVGLHKTCSCSFNFSNAFDTVPHECLLAKLEHYGICGPILDWIREFLTNRHQIVVVNGESSTPMHLDSGVPQSPDTGYCTWTPVVPIQKQPAPACEI